MVPPAERQIDLSIAETVIEDFCRDFSEDWLERVLEVALERSLPAGESGQVSLLIADDALVRELNRVYRGLDEVTDVLSFSTVHQGHWEGVAEPTGPRGDETDLRDPEAWIGFALPPDELPPLGEIIISYPQTRRQAQKLSRPLAEELALLIVHGALHLVGYDHIEPEETALMQEREQGALIALFQPPGARE